MTYVLNMHAALSNLLPFLEIMVLPLHSTSEHMWTLLFIIETNSLIGLNSNEVCQLTASTQKLGRQILQKPHCFAHDF